MFKRQHSKILFLLFIAGVINYLDRAAFSVAMPYIKDHFGLNPAEVGIMLSSFSLVTPCLTLLVAISPIFTVHARFSPLQCSPGHCFAG